VNSQRVSIVTVKNPALGERKLIQAACPALRSMAAANANEERITMKLLYKIFMAGALMTLAISLHAQTRPVQNFDTSAGPVKITPIFHATLLIQAGGKNIYVDPAKPASFTGLPPADLILITHEHGDHVDQDQTSIKAISKPGTEIWAPAAVQSFVTSATVISNGDKKKFDKWTIEAVPSYNLVRGPQAGQFFHPKGKGNGYVLTYGGKRFYFSGDTEATPEMKALKNIDVAFVCMNLPYTMTPDEAADAVKAFHPKVVIPYHYRANPATDVNAFKAKLEGSGIEVRLLEWYPNAS
jgi:L-ascorbate metabolism protein UlaG (beta-lactamase superfamily)